MVQTNSIQEGTVGMVDTVGMADNVGILHMSFALALARGA